MSIWDDANLPRKHRAAYVVAYLLVAAALLVGVWGLTLLAWAVAS